jgi:hypothetical protein
MLYDLSTISHFQAKTALGMTIEKPAIVCKTKLQTKQKMMESKISAETLFC